MKINRDYFLTLLVFREIATQCTILALYINNSALFLCPKNVLTRKSTVQISDLINLSIKML